MVKFFGRTRFVLFLVCIMCLSCAGAASAQDKASLASWFGMEEDDGGMIQALDAPAVSHHGVEMKLGEVLIEDNRVYFSVHVDAGKPISNFTHQLGGDINDGLKIGNETFMLSQEWSYNAQKPGMETNVLSPKILIVLSAEVPADLVAGDQIPMTLKINSISDRTVGPGVYYEGPWTFTFTVDGSKAKELTRTVALDYRFTDGPSSYAVTDFVFSPIRAKFHVQHSMALAKKSLTKNGDQAWIAGDEGNLMGFTIEDEDGNRIEVGRVENSSDTELKETESFIFRSDAENNGWDWLQHADSLTVTPYVITRYGPERAADGIEQFHALEPFKVDLK